MTSFNIYNYVSQSDIDKFQPTFLYIKRHKITGLMYFGKTIQKNVIKYRGGGVRWNNHIKEHGRNHVETIWYCMFTDIHTLVEMAVTCSLNMDILNRTIFANLCIENGITGGTPGAHFSRHKETWSEDRVKQHHEACQKGAFTCIANGSGLFDTTKIDAHSRSVNAAKTMKERGTFNLKVNNEKYKEKRMATAKANGGCHGERNPSFGTKLIHHELFGNKRVIPLLLIEYLDQGWSLGAIKSEVHKQSRLGKKRGPYKQK